MAREHARILCRIWSDRTFVARSLEAQRLYFLVLSQRLLNHAGVVPMTLQKWANSCPDTTADDVLRWLEELARHGFVVFDPATEELLVRSFIRNDGVAKQPNVLKAALRQALDVDSPLVRQALAGELRKLGLDAASQVAEQLMPEGSADVPEPFRNPSRTLPTEPLAKGSPETRGEGDGDGEVGSEGSTSVVGSVRSPRSQAKRGTRIPENFSVTPEMVAWASDRAPGVDGRFETEKFINYWRAKSGRDATKHDWPATWRNWMLNAAERVSARVGVGASRPSTTDQRVMDAQALKSRYAEPVRRLEPGGAA